MDANEATNPSAPTFSLALDGTTWALVDETGGDVALGTLEKCLQVATERGVNVRF